MAHFATTIAWVGADEIIDLQQLRQHVDNGYVKENFHTTEPYAIYNYTPRCVYDSYWDDTTMLCRGLILDIETGSVVARPFEKFFSPREVNVSYTVLERDHFVYDKADGSLGILYSRQDGTPAIATRGSFSSVQALRATAILHEKYPDLKVPTGYTALFEIIYPSNRIVVDYGDKEDLILLSIVNNLTGEENIGPNMGFIKNGIVSTKWWNGPTVELHKDIDFYQAQSTAERTDLDGSKKEGFVVVWPQEGAPPVRLKVKLADYVAKHSAIFGMHSKKLWIYWACDRIRLLTNNEMDQKTLCQTLKVDPSDLLSEDDTLTNVISDLPNELLDWCNSLVSAWDEEVRKHTDVIQQSLPNFDPVSMENNKYTAQIINALPTPGHTSYVWDYRALCDKRKEDIDPPAVYVISQLKPEVAEFPFEDK